MSGILKKILKEIVLCGYSELWNLVKQTMHSGFIARYRQIGKEMQFWFLRAFPSQLLKRRRAKKPIIAQHCLRSMWA